MAGTERHYFARGNTAYGAHFLYDSAFQRLDTLFVLQGPPGTGKSTAIRNAAQSMTQQGWDVQCFHSPMNSEELDGLIITGLKTGIVDGSVCEGIPTEQDGTMIIRLDFAPVLDSGVLQDSAEQLEELKERMVEAYAKGYEAFHQALRIHDEWEKYYIGSMDFEKADQVAAELASAWFADLKSGRKARVRHVFFGAATPLGAVDFIPQLTADLQKRIFVKGRPGSGKSTMLKKLAAAAERAGCDVEVFHCGFDPNSLDMLILPQLSLAIFDSTAPHEYFPERGGDEILDMYERAMTPGTDEAYAAELAEVASRYREKMKEATSHLADARSLELRIKACCAPAIDYSLAGRLQQQLVAAVEELAKNPV